MTRRKRWDLGKSQEGIYQKGDNKKKPTEEDLCPPPIKQSTVVEKEGQKDQRPKTEQFLVNMYERKGRFWYGPRNFCHKLHKGRVRKKRHADS